VRRQTGTRLEGARQMRGGNADACGQLCERGCLRRLVDQAAGGDDQRIQLFGRALSLGRAASARTETRRQRGLGVGVERHAFTLGATRGAARAAEDAR